MMKFNKVVMKTIDIGFKILIVFALVVLISNYLGFKLYVVRSGSMEPNIHTGSLAIVYEKADFYEMEVDDVVAFKLVNGELVTHRITEITKIDGITHFMTKGDANEVSDGYTTNIQNFYGETIWSIPGVGYIADWASSTTGLIILIGSALILLIVYNLLDDGDDEEVEAKEEYEEIVEYVYVDENGNEIGKVENGIEVDGQLVIPPPIVVVADEDEPQNDEVEPPILVVNGKDTDPEVEAHTDDVMEDASVEEENSTVDEIVEAVDETLEDNTPEA